MITHTCPAFQLCVNQLIPQLGENNLNGKNDSVIYAAVESQGNLLKSRENHAYVSNYCPYPVSAKNLSDAQSIFGGLTAWLKIIILLWQKDVFVEKPKNMGSSLHITYPSNFGWIRTFIKSKAQLNIIICWFYAVK